MSGRKKGAQSPEITVSQIFMCAFIRTKVLAVKMGKRVDMRVIARKEMAGFEIRVSM